jgi:competence protein ComFC
VVLSATWSSGRWNVSRNARNSVALRLVSRALDLIYPPRCVGCGEFGLFFCELCIATAPRAEPPRCPRCWYRGGEESCFDCYRHEPAFTELRSPFTYQGAVRKAVHAVKFKGVSALAPPLGAEMASTLVEWSPPVDVIVPVPLSQTRKRTRGYNQAELLAREIAKVTRLPIEPGALRRARATTPQTEYDTIGRRLNVLDAFALGRPVNGNALLIDDVATTTATLDACARVLLEGGAERVYALAFARED